MELNDPIKVHIAKSNSEAHLIVSMLRSFDIPSTVLEDNSDTHLGAMGWSQLHRPKVYVGKSDRENAEKLIAIFEANQHQRDVPDKTDDEIEVVCEACEKVTMFDASLDGTTQNCSHCYAYVDVGEFEWDEDVGEPED